MSDKEVNSSSYTNLNKEVEILNKCIYNFVGKEVHKNTSKRYYGFGKEFNGGREQLKCGEKVGNSEEIKFAKWEV